MAGAFSAKVDISTKEAVTGLRAARTEAQLFGKGLNELDGIIRKNRDNLKLAATEFTKLVAAQRAAAAGAKEMAQADIAAARASGIRNVAEAKKAELLARRGNQEAQAARATAQAGLASARVTDIETRREAAIDRTSRANQRATRSQLELHDSLSNTRYLMYDVGQTYTVLSAGLLAIPAATAAVSMAYQKDFAQVIRVTNDAAGQAALPQLREALKGIATDIPVAFGDLSRITQLGAQMDVDNTKLADFTETTAKFVAVTGISADVGASMFGRMETSFTADVQKYPDFFERLGSSIAQVGADTVATDPEIAALLNQIGPLGAEAGFSAAQITGLSAALASVRVQPELARGTLTRVFGQLNRDVAEGSPKLAEFGKLMGISGEQAGKLWQTNPSDFFQNLIKGLNGIHVNGGNLTTTLDKLGITSSRDVSAVTKLAVGYDVLEKSMKAANQGFSDGTALNEMSKPIFDTAVAKLQKMANAWSNLADTVGGSSLGPLGELIDLATNLAVGLDGLIHDVPMIGSLITALMGMAAVTAVFLGFKAAQAFVIAGFVGFQQASARGIGASMSMSGVLKQAAQTMLITKGATDAQSRALIGQAGAWKALQTAMTTSKTTISTMSASSDGVTASTTRATGGIRGLGSSLLGMVGGPIGIAIIALSALAGALINAQVEADSAGKAIAHAFEQSADAGMREISKQLTETKITPGENIVFDTWGKSIKELADQSGVAFDKVINAASKGKDAIAALTPELDRIAQSKGFKDFADFQRGSTDSAGLSILKNKVGEIGDKFASTEKDTKDTTKALTKLGVAATDTGDDFSDSSTDIDKMTKALKELNDEVFGTINAEADLQDALLKVGEGLYNSKAYGTNTEGGRENLKNFEDAMQKARDYYNKLMADGTLTAEQAAQGYSDFVQGLINQIRVQGGDTSAIEGLAVATAQKFQAVIGGTPATVPVATDTTQVQGEVLKTVGLVSQLMATYSQNHPPNVLVTADDSPARAKVEELAKGLAALSGMPFEVVMDALTDPASDKAKELDAMLVSVANGTYVAQVGADTTAAISNVQNFVAFARTELAHLQSQMNGLNGTPVGYADGEGSMSPELKAQYDTIAAPRQVITKAPTTSAIPAPRTDLGQNLGGITDGYNKAADAAEKAGKKAKKAAEDMADGITDAVRAAEDYGNRLKTGLMSAFNQQYGLTKATDDYHSALNAITKKRDEEMKQLDELKQKVIDLNNERNKELITANKAKIEQGISLKYGEADRAADYGQQAKTALDNAAAKQKDITATNAQAKELSDGIGALTGYSDAAIANREALRDLETKTIDMIAAYAAQGHSIDEVRVFSQNLTGQFQTDVGQLGFNQAAVQGLMGDMGRYIDVVNRVPLVKPTQIEADTEDATKAVGDFSALADNAARDRTMIINVKTTAPQGLGEAWSNITMADGSVERVNRGQSGDSQIPGFYTGGQPGGMVPGTPPANSQQDNMMAKVDGKGLIGIRSREFIEPEEAVNYYGLDFMEAIRTLKLPKYFMGGSPSGRSSGGGLGGGAVELGASTLKALTEAMRTEVALQIDSREIARASNKGNRQLSAEGQN